MAGMLSLRPAGAKRPAARTSSQIHGVLLVVPAIAVNAEPVYTAQCPLVLTCGFRAALRLPAAVQALARRMIATECWVLLCTRYANANATLRKLPGSYREGRSDCKGDGRTIAVQRSARSLSDVPSLSRLLQMVC